MRLWFVPGVFFGGALVAVTASASASVLGRRPQVMEVAVQCAPGEVREMALADGALLRVHCQAEAMPAADVQAPTEPVRIDPPRMVGSEVVVDYDSLLTNDLERLGRLVPHKDAYGVQDGYRISGIGRGSLLESLGFRNGDVLQAVDGQSITRLDDLPMFGFLPIPGQELSVVVERRGERVELRMRIRD